MSSIKTIDIPLEDVFEDEKEKKQKAKKQLSNSYADIRTPKEWLIKDLISFIDTTDKINVEIDTVSVEKLETGKELTKNCVSGTVILQFTNGESIKRNFKILGDQSNFEEELLILIRM